jgi:RNA polymerase sigma-70 factor (ECF subfamily)
MNDMSPPPGQVPDLVARVAAGDREAVVEQRARLRRMLALRLDRRLPGRVDASDVIREGYVDALRWLEEYLGEPSVSFSVWSRLLVGRRVAECHRRHLARPGRDGGAMPGVGSAALAARLLGKRTSPVEAAVRAERRRHLQGALDRMDPIDREVLVLRHDEQLSNGDAAAVLGPQRPSASKRDAWARDRLGAILGDLPGGVGGAAT